ncbi:MAG: hypothetical protein B0D92_03690 [Spirochaeta sp. LUC14_002_19_P3]|nr:MAG: hypothetical protein B0D92_03690 [Spirochaeta sp. LUC14_002_19_P3]
MKKQNLFFIIVGALMVITAFLAVNCQGAGGTDTPAAITETSNANGEIKLSWSEFDSDDTTEYTVYAYNLSVRTATGSTAPTLTEFLEGKTAVTQITSFMTPVADWSGLTEPNTPDSAKSVSSLNLYTGTKYVFLVVGTRSGTVLTDTIVAKVIDIASNTGSDPKYYINSASGTFHVAVIEAENILWINAATKAKAQGGGAKLVEIENATEQSNVEAAIGEIPSADITGFTVVADGGGARYLWIGATDKAAEGTWVWDGDNDGTSSPLGTAVTTSNVLQTWTTASLAYENWGEGATSTTPYQAEPDDYNNQDYAAIALTKWPTGVPYQWNDIAGTNALNGYILEAGKDW